MSTNILLNNSSAIVNNLSFFSPIILCTSVLVFALFVGAVSKALVFFAWVFFVTFIRILAFKGLKQQPFDQMPAICSTGLTEIFIPKDVTYSLFLLTFSLMYFVIPMVLISVQNKINALNYGVLAFFLSYIVLDLFVKHSLMCIPKLLSGIVIGDILSGLFLGGVVAGLIMYGTSLRRYLFINETNSDKEVCSMPTNQQFKCRVYKNGELVGNL